MLLSERDRRRARMALNHAIRTGKVQRPDRCARCGSTAPLDGHHRDWRRPLDVRWLCRPCHRSADAHELARAGEFLCWSCARMQANYTHLEPELLTRIMGAVQAAAK